MICLTLRKNVAGGRRPRATFCLQFQYIIRCQNTWKVIALLYFYQFKMNSHTINKQTGKFWEELIWDEE